ncbi:MAG: hypothetical protein PHN98_10215 [Smithellaceae bacterium]|nr:hypothetical protein [Smithellaceae bacterium]
MKSFPVSGPLRPRIILIVSLLTVLLHQPTSAAVPSSDIMGAVCASVIKLVSFSNNPKAGLDPKDVAVVIDYVLKPKPLKEIVLPKIENASGGYFESDLRIRLTDFLQYSYNSQIPAALTSPSSLRYSRWMNRTEALNKITSSWKLPGPEDTPVVIRQLLRNGITPDQTTGFYYEYDLKRTLILLHYKGRRVLITIAKQANVSDVGKKGFVLGRDDDWNYYYTGIPGAAKPGLGWGKSYIYDFFALGVYIDSVPSPSMIRSGYFQWLRAGWSGVNFVQPEHIIKGMKRHDRHSRAILESPDLPQSNEITSIYQKLSALPRKDLVQRYDILQKARDSMAIRKGKIKPGEVKKQETYANVPKEQIIEELMVEYLKLALGKPSPIPPKIITGVY